MKPKSLMHLMENLRSEDDCRLFLENVRWQGTPVCPHCGSISDKHHRLKTQGTFNGLYKCKDCRKRFTVTVGTMFEGSHITLLKWFYAIYVFLSHKKGISSTQLSKDINVTQKTAWFILARIRCNMKECERVLFDGIVQMDETYVGGKNKGRFKNNLGRSIKQKTPVVGVLTGDRVIAMVVPDTTRRTLHTIIYGLIKPGSTIVTDEWPAYNGLSNEYVHETVEHNLRQYVNNAGFHTNGIEGFWSHLKRGLKGIYHFVKPKYLQMYCNEFAYRYTTRKMHDAERFIQFLSRSTVRCRYSDLQLNIM